MADPTFDLDAAVREATAPAPGFDLDSAVREAADYAPEPRERLGRMGQKYASETSFKGDAEAALAWDKVRSDLITAGMDPDAASAEATRTVEPLQAVGYAEDPEEVRDALDAYKGPLTPGKAYTQITNRLIPLGDNRPSSDDEWRERAAAYSSMGAFDTADSIADKLGGEPLPAEQAKEAGLDREWARKAGDFVRKVALAPGSPIASAVVAAGGVSPYVPTFGDIAGMGQEAMDIVSAYSVDPDVQKLTGGDDRYVVAAGLQKALGRGLVVDTPLADALPMIVDAGIAAHDKVTGEDWASKIKEKHGKSLGDMVSERVDDLRRSDTFDPAAKVYYETGDDSALGKLSDAEIPRNIPRIKPNLATLKAGIEGLADPETETFKKALANNESDDVLQTLADQLPLDVVRKVQPDAGPTKQDVAEAYRRRTAAQEESGSKGADALEQIAGSAMMRPDVIGGEKVFVPSTGAKLLGLLNVAEPAILEADLPMPATYLLGKGLRAVGLESAGAKLEGVRMPTSAGLEDMLASGEYDEMLHALGLAGSAGERQRDGRASYTGRLLADMAMPEYQSMALQKIGRQQGVKPGSMADAALGTTDFAADMLVPWEEIVLGPVGTAGTAARRAWVGGKAARDLGASGSMVRRAALEAAFPTFAGSKDATGALSAALDKGFRKDIRAGRRVFSVGDEKGTMDFRYQRELAQQLKNVGINPDVAFKVANDAADTYKKANTATIREWLKRGAPQDVALRSSPAYKALREQYSAIFAPIDVDAVMALNEQAAWQAVGDGKIASPDEWFAMQRVEKGGVPGEGAYFQAEGVEPYTGEYVRPADTELPAFKAWFGNSKVTSPDGAPKVVYHGSTGGDFSTFDVGRASGNNIYGRGVYFTDNPDFASAYAAGDAGSVFPVYLSLQRPFDFNAPVNKEALTALRDAATNPKSQAILDGFINDQYGRAPTGRDVWVQLEGSERPPNVNSLFARAGYDGLLPVLGDKNVYVAFSPEQIKSATANVGTFDPKNPSILHSRTGPTIHGSIEVPAPTPGNVPNPARAEWVAAGQAQKAKVAAQEVAEVGAWWDRLPQRQGALDDLARMRERADHVGQEFGEGSPEHIKALRRVAEKEREVGAIPVATPEKVAALEDALKRHDWTYAYADDPAEYRKGLAEAEEITRMLGDLPEDVARETFAKLAPEDVPYSRLRPTETPHPRTFEEAQRWWSENGGDAATMPEPSPELLAEMATLDEMRKGAPPKVVPGLVPDQAKWLLRYFQTADTHTLLHENAHLIRFVLGDKWMDELATFFDHEIVDGQKRLTVKGEEQFADALARVLRGRLAPRWRVGAYLSELKDTLADLWRRIRSRPVELPPGFRQWWDAKLDPTASLRTLIDVTDERLPRALGTVGTTVDPKTGKLVSVEDYLRSEPVKRAGQVRGYMDMDLSPGQTQRMFGLGTTQTQANAIDVLAKGIAALGVAEAQRKWGFTGDIARLTARTAVPVTRKSDVLAKARGTLESAMGSVPKDLSSLTDRQAAGLADHVAHLTDAGFREQLPRSLMDPTRDFKRITEDEYRAIVDATVDDVAGPGAVRDRRSEKVAGNLATSLLTAAGDTAESVLHLKAMRKSLQTLFDSSFPISENLNPAAAEVVERARRRFGQIPAEVVRARIEIKRGNPSAMAEDMIRAIADGIPRLGAAPEDVDELLSLNKALGADTTADQVIGAIDSVARQFSADPARSQFQRTSEREAVRIIRDAKRAGSVANPAEFQNAVGVVQTGLHRRSEAVKNTGLKILQGFMGKPELKHAIEDPVIAPAIYKAWYDGDWKEASRLVGTRGGATDPLSNYDPLAAALSVTTQLLGDAAMAKFGSELIDLGLPIHTDAVNLAGRDFARWVPLSDSAHTGEEYRQIVHQYMNAILSFGSHEEVKFTPSGEYVGRERLPAQLLPNGTVNLNAWQDAHRILNAWGVKDGTAKMERLLLPTGEEMWVPDIVQGELSGLFERTAKAGLAWTQAAEGVPEEMLGRFGTLDPATGRYIPNPNRKIRGSWLPRNINSAVGVLKNGWNTSWGLARVGVTTGVGLPNPAFYIGNSFGGILQLYQRKGAVETARALGRYLAPTEGGAVLRSVYARMWGDAEGYFKPASASLMDKAGRVMSDRWIAGEAVAAGLHSSQPKAESAIKLIEDIRRNEGRFWTRVKRDGVWGGAKESFRYWQGLLTDASAAVDDLFRVAAFVDELAGGATSAEAAEVARKAAFDYNDLTEFEKKIMRRVVMFYTYQRRNADLFWWTMLNHPSRIMGQFRAIRDLQEIAFGDEETANIVVPDYIGERAVIALNQAVGDEEAVKGTMGIALLLPPIPAADHFGLWTDIFRALDADSSGRRELLARLTPEAQFPIVMATDMDIFSGRDLAAYNTVPSWMVEMDRQINGGVVVDDLFQVRKTQNRDPASDAVPGEDRWEPTGTGTKWWWVFRNNLQVPPFGRGMDTITQMARADWLISGAVNDARWYRQAGGLAGAVREEVADPLVLGVVRPAMDALPGVDTSGEAYQEAATTGPTEGPRTGFTTGLEGAQLFGLKSVAIPSVDLKLDKAEADRLRRAQEMGKEEERRDPYRYGR